MEKIFKYSLSMYDFARHGYEEALVHGDVKTRSRYYYELVFPVLSFVIGATASFMIVGLGGSYLFLIVGFLLTIATLRILLNLKPYQRAIEDTYFPRHIDRTPVKVHLSLSSKGLMESQELVTLSVPWSEVLSSSVTQDYLVIRLKGLRRLLVPRCSNGFEELNLEEIRQEVNQYCKTASGHIPASNHAGERDSIDDAEQTI